MAVRLLTANANLSTSAGSWKKAEYANLGCTVDITGNYDDINTIRNSAAFNPTVGVTLQGAYIFVRKVGTTGTFTVALQENVLGSWVQKAISAAINVSSIASNYAYFYVPFAVPYVGTSNQFRITLTASNSGQIFWMRSNTAGDFSVACFGNGDDTTKITSTDVCLLDKNVTFTVDESLTLSSSSGRSIIIGDLATFFVTNPISKITMTHSGSVMTGSNGAYKIGTAATPIAAGMYEYVTTSGYQSAFSLYPTPAITTEYKAVFEFNGAEYTDARLILSADAAAGQKVINLSSNIPATWNNGDTVTFAAKDRMAADASTYTITKTGAAQLTLNANLDTKCLLGGAIFNLSAALRNSGIYINSTNNVYFGSTYNSDYLYFNGVYAKNIIFRFNTVGTSGIITKINNSLILFNESSYNPILSTSTLGLSSTNLHFLNQNQYFGNCLFNFINSTFDGITLKGMSTNNNTGLSGSNITFKDMIISQAVGSGGSVSSLHINGSKITFNGLFVIGLYISSASSLNLVFNNFIQQRSSNYGIIFSGATSAIFNNCYIGKNNTNVSYDIIFSSATYQNITMNNTSLGSGIINNYTNLISGSYLRFVNYAGILDDCRAWYRQGLFTSTNPGMIQQQSVGTETLTNTYNIGTRTVASVPMAVLINGKINNAAYYAGVYTLPNIVINVDGVDRSAVSLAANTTQQTLVDSFTPATSNGTLTISLKTKTDATGTNANVLWDTLLLRQRLYGKIFTEVSYDPIQTTDAIIATIDNVAVNPFITQTTKATVQAYTGISVVGTTVTVNENHTINEIYDYLQAHCSDDFSIPEILSTIDGVTFTSTYNFVFSGSAISGSGKILNLGSATLTLSSGATFDGTYISASTRYVPIKLTGLVAGSTVQIYDTNESLEYYKDVVAGTTLLINQVYDADETMRIRIRKAEYNEYETLALRGNNGLNLTIGQTSDTVYTANAIDGSTVTEFSMIDSNVYLYIDGGVNPTTTGQRMYNWYKYIIATTTFIGQQSDLITAETSWSYILSNPLKIKNTGTAVVTMSGANIRDDSDLGGWLDTTGGNIVCIGYFPFSSAQQVFQGVRQEMDVNSTKLKVITGLSAAAASK